MNALVIALLVALFLPACSAQENAAPAPTKKQDQLMEHQSGFLGDMYPRLAPDPTNGDWLLYLRSPDVLQHAKAFLVDHVQVFLVPEAEKRQIPQQDLDKLTDTFTKDIRDELTAAHYTLADAPGPGVVTLRFAITNVEPNGGKTNMAVSGTEALTTHTIAPGAGFVTPRLKVGKVSVEGEVLDSQSGQVEMAFMTSKSGRRFFSGLKAFEKWGDIDAAFKSWAKNFRQRLDAAHS